VLFRSINTMRTVLFVLLAATALALPTEKANKRDDAEMKPKPVAPHAPEGDDYDQLHASWHEPTADKSKEFVPQTGSLISTEAAAEKPTVDPEAVAKDPSAVVVAPAPGSAQVADADPNELKGNENAVHPNPSFQTYPVDRDQTERAYKESSEKIAAATVIDPTKQDIHGVDNGTLTLDRPESPHPMEAKTPLTDNSPCDPTRIIQVSIPGAKDFGVLANGQKMPLLPARYGCSSATDVSREKLSPQITWDNVSEDVFEFSLQMIDMGDNCEKRGPDYGRIHWHVTGIKPAASVTLNEGASHDSRMLHGGQEQTNQWLEDYYSGPCPEAGTTGCYRFKVLAHRANGWCQCGFQDVLFSRPAKTE